MPTKAKKERFPILVSPLWKALLRPLGVTEEAAFAEINRHDLHVRFGRFEYRFPLETVDHVGTGHWPLWAGIGPRFFRGTMGLVGTYVNTVEVQFKEPQPARMLLPGHCERLFLSIEEPGEFIAALTRRLSQETAEAAAA